MLIFKGRQDQKEKLSVYLNNLFGFDKNTNSILYLEYAKTNY
jgi:hypothetical protein